MIKTPVMALHDLHIGQRCLLLGNGISLERLDPACVAQDIVIIGMHRTWRLIETKYHVILRRKEYFQEILDGLWDPPGVIITKRALVGLMHDLSCEVVGVRGRGVLDCEGEMTFDLTRGSASVMCGQLALEVAVWMGFTEIYLIGYDLVGGHAFTDDPEEGHHMRARQHKIMARAVKDVRRERPKVAVTNLSTRSLDEIYP